MSANFTERNLYIEKAQLISAKTAAIATENAKRKAEQDEAARVAAIDSRLAEIERLELEQLQGSLLAAANTAARPNTEAIQSLLYQCEAIEKQLERVKPLMKDVAKTVNDQPRAVRALTASHMI